MSATNNISGARTILILGLFSFVTGLAGASANLALPQLSKAFGITNGAATWTVLIGVITTIIFLILFGHFGDLLSKEDVFLYGGIFFSVGTIICGLAPLYFILLLGRVVQSIGSAMIMANSMGIVASAFPSSKRGKALAAISMFVSVGTVSGPALGGLILSISSWRWIFLLNLPISIPLTVLGCDFLNTTKITLADIKKLVRHSNWIGQLLFSLGMIIFFSSTLFFQMHKPNLVMGGLLLVIGVGLTLYSFFQDYHSKNPWVQPKILQSKLFMGTVITFFLAMLVNVFSNILLPFYLQSFLGVTPFISGLVMVMQSATMFFVAPIAGFFADKINRNILAILGLFFLTLGQIGYALYPDTINYFQIIWPIMINGVGMALFISPNNALSMSYLPKELSGVAGSMNSFFRTLGMGIGISLGSVLLFIQLPGVSVVTKSLGHQFMQAFANVFWMATVVSIFSLAWAVVLFFKSKGVKMAS
jgi:EmrB/QacA subfamily drug resistance transporter